jgi:3-deoxy-D-manno-octulosonic-acid transferase
MTLFFAAYNIVFSLALALAAPFLPLLALFWPKARRGLLQRFGFVSKELRERTYVGEGSLWVHAASLGEVNAVAETLRLLLPRLGGVSLVFSCSSPAGLDQARRLFPEAAAWLLLPIDLPLFLKPLFKRYKPRFAMIVETELWPNFIHHLHRMNCQILLVNGRMTEKSLGRYRLFKGIFQDVLQCFDGLCIQSEDDASRFKALGAKASRITVTGNTKFDLQDAAKAARRKAELLRAELGLKEGGPLIIAGSTREGEETELIGVYARLKKDFKELRLMIAPRHLERLSEVLRSVEAAGLPPSLRSRGAISSDVIILDSLGELSAAYALGDLAWIGGSWLASGRAFGGQNPLEASAQGLPVIFGPDMRHFSEASKALIGGGAAFQVALEGLEEASRKLLTDTSLAKSMGEKGLGVLKRSAGASQKTADLAWKLAVLAKLKREEHDWRNQSAFASLKVSEFGSVSKHAEP